LKIKLSLEAQISVLLVFIILVIIFIVSWLSVFLDNVFLASFISVTIVVPVTLIIVHSYMAPLNRVLSALNDGFQNFLDNDFSVSIAKTRDDELGDLVQVYNKVGAVLRDERIHLYQRELLLDTVIQTTPLSLVLIDDTGAIIYSNSSARILLSDGVSINGLNFNGLLAKQAESFSLAVSSGLSGLFTATRRGTNETYHLTQNQFLLNGRKHQLYLFKSITKEISRQEVSTWKKVIRLISHELNNSLAPITSLAHSGRTLCERQGEEKLATIFDTMGERARYLQIFIEGYAEFARLPKPQCKSIETFTFFENLRQIKTFKLECKKDSLPIYCDPSQLQQAIINLIKNAHESGTLVSEVSLLVNVKVSDYEIVIADRGKGMTEKNLSNALLPFYSTRSGGTGLGLPLCREIVEAHGGKILISNRQNGGLKITILMPNKN
jgi:two-component system nitrogen regulation sensor histidine kinase NtrY